MNNIEKLARTFDLLNEQGRQTYYADDTEYFLGQLEDFAKAYAQQSSEPVLQLENGQILWSKMPSEYTGFLFTHPPASVPLEKYNKLEQQLAELTDAYLLMRTGLNCLSDKSITGNQADILLGSSIPDFINYQERMRDIGSWEKLLTLAKGEWFKQAIAEAEGKEG